MPIGQSDSDWHIWTSPGAQARAPPALASSLPPSSPVSQTTDVPPDSLRSLLGHPAIGVGAADVPCTQHAAPVMPLAVQSAT